MEPFQTFPLHLSGVEHQQRGDDWLTPGGAQGERGINSVGVRRSFDVRCVSDKDLHQFTGAAVDLQSATFLNHGIICNRRGTFSPIMKQTQIHSQTTHIRFFLSSFSSIRRCLRQAMVALSRPSTLTSRNWRSPRPSSPPSPRAPPWTSSATGNPTATRMEGSSTTTAQPRRGPGNRREPRTQARGASEERTTARGRALRCRSC